MTSSNNVFYLLAHNSCNIGLSYDLTFHVTYFRIFFLYQHKSRYRNDSIKPPGAYLSKVILGVGAYSRGGLFEGGGLLNSCAEKPFLVLDFW